jgi:hypothetical protein
VNLKIVYLDLPFWRAEVARLALFIANVKFEDLRISSAEFNYLQENGKLMDGTLIPFNQLPVLVINGQSIAQTGGIEAGKVDQIIDTVTDINELLNPSMRENDPIKKRVMRAELTNKNLPNYFGFLENILRANNSNWFVGDKMSVADIAVWGMLGWITSGVLDDIPPSIVSPFKRLKKLYNEVSQNPRVMEWKIKTYAHEKTSTDEYAFDVPDKI